MIDVFLEEYYTIFTWDSNMIRFVILVAYLMGLYKFYEYVRRIQLLFRINSTFINK